MTQAEINSKKVNLMAINTGASSLGFLLGLGFAYHRKSKFWGYVGWGLLGSVVIGEVAGLATLPMAASITKEQVKLNDISSPNGIEEMLTP